ncbi:MAG: isocitrate lyase/phosphoenolpyruvate mutase family protein [Chitinophagaceae bacterium]
MSARVQKFRDLHAANGLFVLPNAWNVKSALQFQQQQFPAIATSSAAVAESLGYKDGEEMPFSDYLFVIRRILAAIEIPLSVDIEMGYGITDEDIYNNVLQLIELGVVGINIEDSLIYASGRVLKDAKVFAGTIAYLKNKLAAEGLDLFINVRCDTYILNVQNKQEETKKRLKLYEAAGADGIFLPCISVEKDIETAISNTRLPLNVMCIPGLPGFEVLEKLGVKRASMGPFLFNKVYNNVGSLSREIIGDDSFQPILS